MSSQDVPHQSRAPIQGKGSHALMSVVARAATEQFSANLEQMFSACDDFFFDLASRTKIAQVQNHYFEALREIRLRKGAVIQGTLKRFAQNFSAIQRGPSPAAPATTPAPSAETMKLVPHEQIEKDAVVTDMVSRARLEWQQEFFQLNERLLAIAPARFEEKQSPFDAGQIAEAFVSACEVINIDLPTLKLLLKQFDRCVLNNLDDLYLRANQILIDARVRPELTRLSRRPVKKYALPPRTPKARDSGASGAGATGAAGPSGTGGAHSQASVSVTGIPESEPETRELAHLLQRMRSSGIRLSLFPNLPAASGAPPIGREELVALLSEVQSQPVARADGQPELIDIRHAIEAIATRRGQMSLGPGDEDIINVVAMFFDIILDDRNLPIEIQALVSRLQIPILKVALKDRTFFTDRTHSARQLINEIARASIGWESSSKAAQDAWFLKLSSLVDEVLHNPTDGIEVFDRCLAELSGLVERAESRSAKVEKRTSERAAAEAKTAKARGMVRHVLHERLEGRALPAEITTFLIEDWQPVLQIVYVKHGKDSPEWIDAVQTVDDLVWSIQSHADEKSRARLERLLPDLQKRMATGLGQIRSNAEDVRARLEVIREIQDRLVAADGSSIPLEPLTPSQQRQIALPTDPEQKSWKEMTAVERQKVQYEALMFEYLKRVDEMPLGTWLLYDDLRRGSTRRCKLSARIADSQSFVFVNRLGVHVYEKPRKAFAYDLQMGHARVIEDKPLVERTIALISVNLRRMVGESADGST